MADNNNPANGAENNPGAQNNEGAGNNNGTQNTGGAQDEKKYTETDMNNISKKNSEKAVAKVLKDLGITDTEKAKAILAKAAADEEAAAKAKADASDNQVQELNEKLSQATESANNAVLENLLLMSNVKSDKVARAARLIDKKDCLDEDGNFSREKAGEAVKKLLEEWPELAPKEEGGVGFRIGGDGEQNGGKSAAKEKQPVQKSWNRFNH
ncbi:MAG: hypothetical protein J6L91_07480 [Clostridia bacterium]|nr:hypothetical protein [Clostridia bacterium]